MEINHYQIYREINKLRHFQICSNKHETPLVYVDLAQYELFRAKVGEGGLSFLMSCCRYV